MTVVSGYHNNHFHHNSRVVAPPVIRCRRCFSDFCRTPRRRSRKSSGNNAAKFRDLNQPEAVNQTKAARVKRRTNRRWRRQSTSKRNNAIAVRQRRRSRTNNLRSCCLWPSRSSGPSQTVAAAVACLRTVTTSSLRRVNSCHIPCPSSSYPATRRTFPPNISAPTRRANRSSPWRRHSPTASCRRR